MQLYFRAAVFYAAFSFLIVSLRFGDPIELISTSVVATLAVTGYNALHVVLPVLLALFVVLGRLAFLKRGSEALYAVFGALILQLAFSFVKSTIPALVPFYADPYLASVDRVLAGGQDAWRVANDIGPYVGARMLLPAYLNVWTVFVMAMPLAVALHPL